MLALVQSSEAYEMGRRVGTVLGVGLFLLLPVGLCALCIVGAVKARGGLRVLSIIGACVLGLWVLCAGLGVLVAVARAAQTGGADAGKVLTFKELGFQYTLPGRPWTQVDARKLNPHAAMVLQRGLPERCFMVIAENVGADSDLTSEGLAEISKHNLQAAGASYRLLDEGEKTIGGMSGVIFRSDATVSNMRLAYCHWCCAGDGYLFQLMVWGRQSDREGVDADADTLFSRFARLGPPDGGTDPQK